MVAGALCAHGAGGIEESGAGDRFVGGLDGVDPLIRRVVGHVGAVAEGDVVDVEEAFFLALFVPDFVAGVAGVEEDGAYGALLPGGLVAVRIAGGVVGGGTGDAFPGELGGDGAVAHAVHVQTEDPLHDGRSGGVQLEPVDALAGGWPSRGWGGGLRRRSGSRSVAARRDSGPEAGPRSSGLGEWVGSQMAPSTGAPPEHLRRAPRRSYA
ncbi:hypothetical protein GCM10010448_04820 [Streptomyces glomeratus]|uniref:Uncharacterized protein n=1 Tax=Streptomyces glomeratus TaxID=284452 RepID=A0ABP6KX15_9ACTN